MVINPPGFKRCVRSDSELMWPEQICQERTVILVCYAP